ncbi:MAG: hypothetical protein ACON4X_05225 [Polaribacter sp.]|jgi:hypothetical protein
MASIKNLKKDIHYVLGDIIDECLSKDASKADKAQKIIDDAITVFDELIAKIYQKDVENQKAHFSAINQSLEKEANALLERANKL